MRMIKHSKEKSAKHNTWSTLTCRVKIKWSKYSAQEKNLYD